MLKWFLVLGVLVAIGYQICVSVVHPVPTELEERDKVAVLDAIGHIGNNVVNTLVVQCSKCMDITQIRDTTIAEVPVRVFIPRKQKKAMFPAMIYLHGGGWPWLSVGEWHLGVL